MVAIERPFSWFLGTRGLLLFNEMWLWRQNFFRMARLSFQWQAATLKDIKRLWKRNGGNRRPFSWFLGTRGLLLFNESVAMKTKFFQNGQIVISMTGRNSQGYKKAVEEKWWQSRGLLVGFWGPGAFCYLMKCGYEDKIFSEWPDCHFNDRPQLSRI